MTPLLQALHVQVGNGAAVRDLVIGLALAVLVGQLAAWTYMYTHTGVSYSRSFVQSIVLLTVIVTLAMMIIGNNVVVAFGLFGALSMIRFRNVLKDTRDTSFVFFAVVSGIACGTGRHALAMVGTLLFCLLLLYLHLTSFGTRRPGDAFLRFQADTATWKPREFQMLLRRHCLSNCVVTQRIDESGRMEIAFQLVMRDPERAGSLVEEVRQEHGLSGVSFLLQTDEGEV